MADYCKHCYREHLGLEGDDFSHFNQPGAYLVVCEGCGVRTIKVWEEPPIFAWEVMYQGDCVFSSDSQYKADLQFNRLWQKWYDHTMFMYRGKCPYHIREVEVLGPHRLRKRVY